MTEFQKIKETAFELLMNLSPKQIKVLNNQILRPLYRMVEQQSVTVESRQDVEALKEKLQQTELDSIQIIHALQNEITGKDEKIAQLEGEIQSARKLADTRQQMIDRLANLKKKVAN